MWHLMSFKLIMCYHYKAIALLFWEQIGWRKEKPYVHYDVIIFREAPFTNGDYTYKATTLARLPGLKLLVMNVGLWKSSLKFATNLIPICQIQGSGPWTNLTHKFIGIGNIGELILCAMITTSCYQPYQLSRITKASCQWGGFDE